MIQPTPPDQAARDTIRQSLEQNILVEAGAGSGKTTELVERLVATVRAGKCKVEAIAAVTFTRKAAAELRQRFQQKLEELFRNEKLNDGERANVAEAIQKLNYAFLGTIHSFCARLLRERPLEVGLDPAFQEIMESEAAKMQKAAWIGFVERMEADGDVRLERLEKLGIEAKRLEGVFNKLVEHPDVDFGFEEVDPPDPEEIESVRQDLDALLDRANALLPRAEPEKGWDSFAKRLRTLLYWRRALDWKDRTVFFDALSRVYGKKCRLVQNRWSDTPQGKTAAKEFGQQFESFVAKESEAGHLLAKWWAHRYPVVLGVAKDAERQFAKERLEAGVLTFQDMLVLTAQLLRENPSTRRDLGKRYECLLVDEFQDTDPLQAEILFLLASEPGSSGRGNGKNENWRKVIPRAGALFVVGDPKQSIYRFRRADISLYDDVKKRFAEFGTVLGLKTNFRSLPAFEDLVRSVFDNDRMFPEEATDRQAGYAPLISFRRHEEDQGAGKIVTYPVSAYRNADMAQEDAEKVASLIAKQVADGKRQPGDFLVLTEYRKYLFLYAHALENNDLLVDVSGADLGSDRELAAFLLLFRCLADGRHPVRVLGTLTGPFFGLPLDQIVAYRDAGGSFSIDQPHPGESEVARTLNQLHRWWLRARHEPSDITADRLVREIGLFPFVAAGQLGSFRAGALVYLLDAVRAAALEGDTSLAGAVAAMETALESDDAEAPLVPGRKNAVKVMNLHRAKGLEANVVFLASPYGIREKDPQMHVVRDSDGKARGTIPVVERISNFTTEVIAQPLSWPCDQTKEAEFKAAEKVRLLYVAATRARDELWVSRANWLGRKGVESPWAAVANNATGTGEELISNADEKKNKRPTLDADTDLTQKLSEVAEARKRADVATYDLTTVTARAKGGAMEQAQENVAVVESDTFTPSPLAPESGGYVWGSVVHRVLAAASSGTPDDVLAQLARDCLIQNERPQYENGDPTELGVLLDLVASVRKSEIWARAMASDERYTEMPFAVHREGEDGLPEVLEGVMDLVFKEGGSWVVADFKTDVAGTHHFADRVPEYRNQVDLYAECWEELSGEPVGERVLVFTAQGRAESW